MHNVQFFNGFAKLRFGFHTFSAYVAFTMRKEEAETGTIYGVQELDVTLIRVTNYTDDGYPIKTRLGVIRSNTLTQMATLVRALANYPFFKDISLKVHMIDEAIEKIPVKKILKRSKMVGVKSIIMLVGVQTNQYPRAMDIASWFLPHGISVLMGGFHVSGMLAMIGLTADLREAMSKGIILVAGEVEGERLPKIVEDVIRKRAEPLYNFMNTPATLTDLPTPCLTRDDLKGFASPYSTIDTGRGCIFTCDFCTIINVQGRTMRCRNPEQVIDFVRHSYQEMGITHCFFTDDNIARNPQWRELFTRLIRLREEEKIPFTFMMQSDLAARKIPPGDFFKLAARAGCNEVFLGVESVNRENLRSKEKFSNQVSEYQSLVEHCHSLGIACHAGYILGLPFDTLESLEKDIAELQRLRFDSASFYIMTPLPGSKDHQQLWNKRQWLDKDFNTYDAAHVSVEPERMTRDELMQAYRKAWEQFYSTEYMVSVLKTWRNSVKHYWGRMFFFAWYLYASRIERLHPMNCGFWTVRYRSDRRPSYPRETFFLFWWGRFKFSIFRLQNTLKLFFQLEEVWLRSRPKSRIEEALHELIVKTKQDILDSTGRIVDWRDLKARELRTLYEKLHIEMPTVKVPFLITLWFKKWNPFTPVYSREHIQRIWRKWYLHFWNPLRWVEVWVFEVFNGLQFLKHFFIVGR